MTIRNHTLGFPRIGLNRELKKAQESYWAGDLSQSELLAVGKNYALVIGNSKLMQESNYYLLAILLGTTKSWVLVSY